MATQASTSNSGFFYRQPSSGNADVPPTPPEGNGRRFTGKQLLLAFLGGSLAIGYLTRGDSDPAPITHFAHPVHITGTGVSVRSEPLPDASAIASVSSSDSVENMGRINDQWSRVKMHDGRTGFVSNEFLEGVNYVPLAAAALAATTLARPYTSGSTTPYTPRRSGRLLRSRRGRSTLSYTTPAPAPTRPSKAPTYTTTYSTAPHSSAPTPAHSRPSKAPTYTTTYSTAPRSSAPSYRSSSSSPRTYSAPRVNSTFSSRSTRRRR